MISKSIAEIRSTIVSHNKKDQEKLLPYPEALKNASIITDKLDSPVLHGMIQGNGDLHSFFYAKRRTNHIASGKK